VVAAQIHPSAIDPVTRWDPGSLRHAEVSCLFDMALADSATLAHGAAIENGQAADFSSISEVSPRVRNGLRLLERVNRGQPGRAAQKQ